MLVALSGVEAICAELVKTRLQCLTTFAGAGNAFGNYVFGLRVHSWAGSWRLLGLVNYLPLGLEPYF